MNRRDLFKGILGLTGALALGKQVAPQRSEAVTWRGNYLLARRDSAADRLEVSQAHDLLKPYQGGHVITGGAPT